MIALGFVRLGRIGLFAALALGATTASAQTPIKFSLDFKFEGPSAPFLIGLDKGYYKAEGLEVTLDQGNGSGAAVPLVANGTYDVGFGDINALIQFAAAVDSLWLYLTNGNVIGGTVPAARNLISGNSGSGIFLLRLHRYSCCAFPGARVPPSSTA